MSIERQRRADKNGHYAFKHAETNGDFLRHGTGGGLERQHVACHRRMRKRLCDTRWCAQLLPSVMDEQSWPLHDTTCMNTRSPALAEATFLLPHMTLFTSSMAPVRMSQECRYNAESVILPEGMQMSTSSRFSRPCSTLPSTAALSRPPLL